MGITTFGGLHTLVGLAALLCGFIALAQSKQILAGTRMGLAYLLLTLVTAVSGLFIFHHGGFGPPHVLSILTILALAVGTVAARTALFGRLGKYIQAVCYSTTFMFHFIPGFTETLTRLPVGDPIANGPQSPILQGIFGVLFVIYFIGLALQVWWLHKSAATGAPSAATAG